MRTANCSLHVPAERRIHYIHRCRSKRRAYTWPIARHAPCAQPHAYDAALRGKWRKRVHSFRFWL